MVRERERERFRDFSGYRLTQHQLLKDQPQGSTGFVVIHGNTCVHVRPRDPVLSIPLCRVCHGRAVSAAGTSEQASCLRAHVIETRSWPSSVFLHIVDLFTF